MVSGKYFNRGVKSIDNPDIGYVVRETPDKIIVFGGKGNRYDIPIKEIAQVGANVLIGLNYDDIIKNTKLLEELHYQLAGPTLGLIQKIQSI